MKDTISIETLQAVRSKLLEKAGKNPLQLVAVTDKNGHTVHRWKNMMSDQEVPEEMWTDEMKEQAKAATAKLLAGNSKSSSNKTPSRKKIEAEKKKANIKMSDDDFLTLYHSKDERSQRAFKQAAYDKIKGIVDAQRKRYWQFDKNNPGVLDDVEGHIYESLVSPRERQKGKNAGVDEATGEKKKFSDLDLFEMARDKARVEGKKEPNLEQYMVLVAANKFKNAIDATNKYEQTHDREGTVGSDDEGSNYSADQLYGGSVEFNADEKATSAEELGEIRQGLGDAIRALPPDQAVVMILKRRGWTNNQISEKTGWSYKQVDHLFSDARKGMADFMHLKKYGEPENSEESADSEKSEVSADSEKSGSKNTGKATRYIRSGIYRAIEEEFYNLEKAEFLRTLEK